MRILGVTMTRVKEERITNETICQILFDIPKIKNQVAKQRLNFIGRVTRNSDKQLTTKLITEQCKNKRRVGGVIHSQNKDLLHNILLIVSKVDLYGSLKLWAHLTLDKKYWKYLINGIGNAPTPPLVPLSFPTNERTHLPSTHYPPCPSKALPTLSPPRQKKTL